MRRILDIIVTVLVILIQDLPIICEGSISVEVVTKSQIILENSTNLPDDNKTNSEKQSLTEMLDNNRCKAYGTCDYNKGMGIPVCYCDGACTLFNDCCFDYVQPKTDGNYLEVRGLQRKMDFVSCQKNPHHFMSKDSRPYGCYSISNCPPDYPLQEVSLNCRSGDFFPVHTTDGITFRNAYCAYCHGENDYTAWQIYHAADCMKPMLNENNIQVKLHYILNSTSGCKYYFFPPSIKDVRYCSLYDKARASETIQLELCESSVNSVVAVIHGTRTKYFARNTFCLQKDTEFSHCIEGEKLEGLSSRKVQLNWMLNIRPPIEVSGQKICKVDEYYSEIHDTCISKDCNRTKDDMSCSLHIVSDFAWKTYRVSFITYGLVEKDWITRVAVFLYLSLPRERDSVKFEMVYGSFGCGNSSIYFGKRCCVFDGYAVFALETDLTSEALQDFLENVEDIQWNFSVVLHNETIKVGLYQSGETNETCSMNGLENRRKSLYFLRTFNSYQQQFIFDDTNRSRSEIPTFFRGSIFMKKETNDRQVYEIRDWEFQYRTNNVSVLSSITVSADWSISVIMTYVTMVTSCLSLLVTIIVYRVLDLSASPPGIISQNLMGTLPAAQLLFLVGAGQAKDIKALCFTIGVALHHLWLCAFTWKSVFLFSVLTMMRKLHTDPGKLAGDQNLSKLVPFTAYTIPLFIVVPCLFLDLFSDIEIGYLDNICFPTAFPANIFSFTLPVLTSLIINVISLVCTSISISRFNNTAKLIHSVQKTRSFIPMYIRLCMMCACPWIIGMIANLLQSEILGYMFILSAGSQGTFVAISFLTSKSVRIKLRSKCFKKSPSQEIQLKRKTPRGKWIE